MIVILCVRYRRWRFRFDSDTQLRWEKNRARRWHEIGRHFSDILMDSCAWCTQYAPFKTHDCRSMLRNIATAQHELLFLWRGIRVGLSSASRAKKKKIIADTHSWCASLQKANIKMYLCRRLTSQYGIWRTNKLVGTKTMLIINKRITQTMCLALKRRKKSINRPHF